MDEASEVQDNLKQDFIMFKPNLNGMSKMECTCGDFEASTNHDVLAKWAVRHCRRTGHVIKPRGN